jgi:hypothetical protein
MYIYICLYEEGDSWLMKPSADVADVQGRQASSHRASPPPPHTPHTHLSNFAPNQETIIQCVQLLTLWQLIAGSNQAQQRHRQAFVAVVKKALIQQCQQCVQDGGVGLENLIHKRHLCCWQITLDLSLVTVIFEAWAAAAIVGR